MTSHSRLDPGYMASAQVKETMLPFTAPAPVRILLDGLGFHATLLVSTFLVAHAVEGQFAWAVVGYPFVAIFAARQLRAFELIVHDASHYNFIPSRRLLNDRMTDVLFAAPVAQVVRRYRTTHKLHHQNFGTPQDPCRNRMLSLTAEDSRRRREDETIAAWVRRIFHFYFKYTSQYYRAVTQNGPFLRIFAAWHLAVSLMTGLAAVQLGLSLLSWLIAWTLIWIVPLFLFLPVQRMLAEMGEHDYRTGKTEFDATISNVGLLHRIVLHPWNDSYHLLHHLFQAIPQTRHPAAHRVLDRVDPQYRCRRLRRSVGGTISEGA